MPLIQGLVQQVGGSYALATAIGLCAAAGLICVAWRVRRDDIAGFALILAAAIVASPIAWVGYATLLVVPLAARTERFTSAWLLLLGFGYLHWWHSPLFFRSAGLSVATIALTAGLTYFACAPARRTSPEESAAAIRTASPSGSPGEEPAW